VFLDAGYPNLQRDNNDKITPKPAEITMVNWLMIEVILVIMVIYAAMVLDQLQRSWSSSFRPGYGTRRCRCRITLERACLVACCHC
jgi:hypothetical protein